MELVRVFDKISKEDVAIAGGKGASLGEMIQAGLPIPEGFVVLSDAFEKFLEETDLQAEIQAELDKVDSEKMHTVENASEVIQSLILGKEMPEDIAKKIKEEFQNLQCEYVAVRSSATSEDSASAAWAGQLDTFLNTTESKLLENVRKCWASLFTPRAIFYRFEQGLHKQKISVAVVVQKMVQSEKSGIAFSVHPVTEDYNQLIIEAGLGLGEAIVSGQVTPDSYVFVKKEKEIIDINVSEQKKGLYRSENGNEWKDLGDKGKEQVLNEKEILELSDLIIKIEKHYSFPCDIEWAYDSKFYITQSRPITTLQKKEDKHPISGVDWVRFMDRKRSCFIYYPFIDVEYNLLPKVAGFGYKNHLYRWHGEQGTHYRSASELQESLEHFLSIVKNKPEKVKEIRDLCLEWDKKGNELIELFESFEGKKIPLKDFKKYYEDFANVLLYTVTAPYLCMCGIDMALEKGENKEQFKEALEILDPLRAFSVYPKLEKTMLSHFWDLLSKETRIDDKDLFDKLTPEEVTKYAGGKGLPPLDELKKRKEWCVFWHDTANKKIVFEYDKSIVNELPVLRDEEVKSKSEIKGNTAFPGVVRGTVRIIDNTKDMERYNEGDIVVSISTNPELMPVLRTCSAIITDEGGIMCHAAIVSRELKKPCVIGTKHATKLLKDGMEVEVDADKGLVRILNEKLIFEDIFNHDFPLILAQINNQGETIKEIPWADEPFTISPYCIHARTDGMLHYLYDVKGIEWKKSKAGNYNKEECIAKSYESYEKIKKIVEAEEALSRDELIKFWGKLKEAWMWFDCFYWMTEYCEEKGLPMEDLLKLRKDTEYFAPGVSGCLRNTLKKLFPEKTEYIDFITYEEAISGQLPSDEILQKRREGFAYVNEEVLDSAEEAMKKYSISLKKHDLNAEDELTGQIAYKGRVRGKVRIIRKRKEISSFKEGEILVASSTTPDFLPAMKRAGAIVSEHGGAVSHAAITSRELKIPCIVGVKGALQVLKDGMEVEVDADKGVVRVL